MCVCIIQMSRWQLRAEVTFYLLHQSHLRNRSSGQHGAVPGGGGGGLLYVCVCCPQHITELDPWTTDIWLNVFKNVSLQNNIFLIQKLQMLMSFFLNISFTKQLFFFNKPKNICGPRWCVEKTTTFFTSTLN